METTVNIKKLEEYMTKENISKRELARRMHIDDGHLVKVLNGAKNPGIKFVQGMISIGCKSTEIFIKKQCKKTLNDTNVAQYICDYMNTMSMSHNKEYKIYEIHNIRNSIDIEKTDRSKSGIRVNGNTIEGRKELNERISKICNENFATKLTYRDVQLYKKCSQLEAKDRNLINSIENDDE